MNQSRRINFFGRGPAENKPMIQTWIQTGIKPGQPRATQASRIVNLGSASTSVRIPELYNVDINSDVVPDSVLEYLLFEQIAGQELLLTSRTDLLNGQNVSYGVISNLTDLQLDYSPSNILAVPNTLPDLFKVYGLVLESYVPILDIEVGGSLSGNESPNAYIDLSEESTTKNQLVIEFKNMQSNYDVEIQVLFSGIIKDTII
jgi:hypothetical protein